MFRFSSSKRITIFPSNILKNLAFTISKHYFYNFNSSFYNIPIIKHSIFLQLYLNILSFNIFLHFYYYFSLSLYLSLPLYLHISQPDLEASSTSMALSISPLTMALNSIKKKFKKKKKKETTHRTTSTHSTTPTTTNNQPPNQSTHTHKPKPKPPQSTHTHDHKTTQGHQNPPTTQIRFYKNHPLIPMTQGVRWLRQGDLEDPVKRSCRVGQGDLKECEACGGSSKANRRYEKKGDEEHRDRGRRRA